jgi:hypothetical protein
LREQYVHVGFTESVTEVIFHIIFGVTYHMTISKGKSSQPDFEMSEKNAAFFSETHMSTLLMQEG